VNFGRRWTRDSNLTILRRSQKALAAVGIEANTFAGRRIQVRGWIEQRGGAVIEAEAPEQIELLG
jgi:hypothetical protein